MGAFALTRWPGVLPLNFSAAYALLFCAGVYLPRPLARWLPLATMLVTDLALNLYYSLTFHINSFSPLLLANYVVYAGMIWLGTRFRPHSHFLRLLCGGLLGAVVFYLVTNTAAWFLNPFGNPEYTRTLMGWITALTKGTAGFAQTWEFFRNTLLSGGLFTGLFVATMKLTAHEESSLEKDPQSDSEGGLDSRDGREGSESPAAAPQPE